MLGSNLIALAIKLTTGKSIKDPTSGMRMYNRKCVELLMNDSNFGPEPDVIAFIIKNGLKVREVQVKMQERISGESYLRFGSTGIFFTRKSSAFKPGKAALTALILFVIVSIEQRRKERCS